MRRRAGYLTAAVAAAAGCAETSPDAVPAALRADSAGVEIVQSPRVHEPWAVLDSVAEWSLGGIDAVGPTQFSGIDNIHPHPDGDIWVADRPSRRIEVFTADGAHRFGVGGRGDGPTEYQRLRLLGGDSSGAVFAIDAASGRFVAYGPDGDVLETDTWERAGRPLPNIHGVAPDGDLIGWIPETFNVMELSPGDITGDSVDFSRWSSPNAEPADLHTVPWVAVLHVDGGGGPIPFLAVPGVAQAELTWFTSGADFQVVGFDETGARRILRMLSPPRPVTDDHVAAYRADVEERFAGNQMMRLYLEPLEHPSRPDFLPAFDGLLVDDRGRVWARRWVPDDDTDRIWEVFGIDGTHVGHVAMPRAFDPFAIRDEGVIGVWTDEFDVEYVRRFALRHLD